VLLSTFDAPMLLATDHVRLWVISQKGQATGWRAEQGLRVESVQIDQAG
jgi:hypothetical protein